MAVSIEVIFVTSLGVAHVPTQRPSGWTSPPGSIEQKPPLKSNIADQLLMIYRRNLVDRVSRLQQQCGHGNAEAIERVAYDHPSARCPDCGKLF